MRVGVAMAVTGTDSAPAARRLCAEEEGLVIMPGGWVDGHACHACHGYAYGYGAVDSSAEPAILDLVDFGICLEFPAGCPILCPRLECSNPRADACFRLNACCFSGTGCGMNDDLFPLFPCTVIL